MVRSFDKKESDVVVCDGRACVSAPELELELELPPAPVPLPLPLPSNARASVGCSPEGLDAGSGFAGGD